MLTAISIVLLAAMVLSGLVALCYLIKLVIVHPFQAGILWLLGCLFVPFCTVFFIVAHWHHVRETLFRYLLSCAVAGMFLGMLFTVHGGNATLREVVAGRAATGESHAAAAAPERPRKMVTLEESRAELDALSKRVDLLTASVEEAPEERAPAEESAPAPATASDLLKESAERTRNRAASDLLASFQPGRKYLATWSWGSTKGELLLTVVESRDGRFQAELSSKRDPRQSRRLEGTVIRDKVKMKTVWRAGIPREDLGGYARDASRRWLADDAEFEIALVEAGEGFVGSSGSTKWRLRSESPVGRRS